MPATDKNKGKKADGKSGGKGAAAAVPAAALHSVVYSQSQSEIKDDFSALVTCLVRAFESPVYYIG
jgi:hypothetical protein